MILFFVPRVASNISETLNTASLVCPFVFVPVLEITYIRASFPSAIPAIVFTAIAYLNTLITLINLLSNKPDGFAFNFSIALGLEPVVYISVGVIPLAFLSSLTLSTKDI